MPTVTYQTIKEYIDQIWVVDTHEHLTQEQAWLEADEGCVDFSRFFAHYASVDLISAGLPNESLNRIRSEKTPLDEKWALFEPFWEKAKYTAYCRAVDLAIKELFDLPGLSRETYKPLAEKMRKMRKPGYYRHVLKDKGRIAVSILDLGADDADREFFVPVARLDHFIMVHTLEELRNLENESGMSIHSLDDLTAALAKVFQTKKERGAVAIKSGLAYVRTLNYEYPSKAEAERVFNQLFTRLGPRTNDGIYGTRPGEAKVLQDYMFHKIVQLCVEHDLPFQIHTGIQEGNGNCLEQSNPVLLNDVFLKYPKARFDIFHAGYPYWDELGVMAKMFPGVHADLCWMNVISPAAARRALDEWLEVMPASKIFAFGGDYIFVEGAYAHSRFARDNVAKVLAAKVDDGYFTLEDAKRVADMILRENANEFFKLGL